jgi:hypothetical protein
MAEARAKRRDDGHFIIKLVHADGKPLETLQGIETADDCGYFPSSNTASLNNELSETG